MTYLRHYVDWHANGGAVGYIERRSQAIEGAPMVNLIHDFALEKREPAQERKSGTWDRRERRVPGRESTR